MIFAEALVLLAFLGGGTLGVGALVRWARLNSARDAARRAEAERRSQRMADDLREALRARDYRQLDDWLVLYSDNVSDKVRGHVEQRRAELYIEPEV